MARERLSEAICASTSRRRASARSGLRPTNSSSPAAAAVMLPCSASRSARMRAADQLDGSSRSASSMWAIAASAIAGSPVAFARPRALAASCTSGNGLAGDRSRASAASCSNRRYASAAAVPSPASSSLRPRLSAITASSRIDVRSRLPMPASTSDASSYRSSFARHSARRRLTSREGRVLATSSRCPIARSQSPRRNQKSDSAKSASRVCMSCTASACSNASSACGPCSVSTRYAPRLSHAWLPASSPRRAMKSRRTCSPSAARPRRRSELA